MTQKKLDNAARLGLVAQGRVQGVGFRPFVWRLANELGLTGMVKNTSAGARIEVQGPSLSLAEFLKRLQNELPPLALISSLEKEQLVPVPLEASFQIGASTSHAGQHVLVSPDIGICPECLADIRNPANFRYGYPFANCVNCGPRFTITRSIPYDRASTVMACFELCENCAAEYVDPANRRFHAQPIACAACGPAVWYVDHGGQASGCGEKSTDSMHKALERAACDIISGKIVAIKGLGGFQLACDARNEEAVDLLRKRKRRPHKALAVMTASTEDAALFCAPGKEHMELMESPERPIVLCPKKESSGLAAGIAPDTPHVGVMLPYTPLHALLLDSLEKQGLPNPVLVMTSANPPGEPICLGNREALSRLAPYADSWLLHDRDILVRVDDSVTGIAPSPSSAPLIFRRARGYVPSPLELPAYASVPPVLGAGGDLKAAFCLSRSNLAFMSQHIGDLQNVAALAFYEESLKHLQRLLECEPGLIVHDSHPDFLSRGFARELAQKCQLPSISLQHHAAHAASVLAENRYYAPALALCLDGSGYGEDGSVWGGELLCMDLSRPSWERVGSFSPFPLPGGEKAILEPWRIAIGLKFLGQRSLPGTSGQAEKAVLKMLERNLNCPSTSSCGRLFDAMAASLGLCEHISYEGQAAIRLMNAAWPKFADLMGQEGPSATRWLIMDQTLPHIDSLAIFSATLDKFEKDGDQAGAAAFFHQILSDALVELCLNASRKLGITHVGLSGGVFQNALLVALLQKKLSQTGLQPLWHVKLPPGDGGLAFGQCVWGRQMLAAGKLETSDV